MHPPLPVFDHARTSQYFSDPGGKIAEGVASGKMTQASGLPQDASWMTDALNSSGRLPVNDHSNGYGAIQTALIAGGAACVILGATVAVTNSSVAARWVLGVVFALIGVLVIWIGCTLVGRRRRALEQLCMAWNNGWLRYAPAHVGGVWVTRKRETQGEGSKEKAGNYDVEYYFSALVKVYPVDGEQPFTFEAEEFRAVADQDGNPKALRVAPNPVDALEPEFSNGWTIARYVAGAAADTATITTNLSASQVDAALQEYAHRRD